MREQIATLTPTLSSSEGEAAVSILSPPSRFSVPFADLQCIHSE